MVSNPGGNNNAAAMDMKSLLSTLESLGNAPPSGNNAPTLLRDLAQLENSLRAHLDVHESLR